MSIETIPQRQKGYDGRHQDHGSAAMERGHRQLNDDGEKAFDRRGLERARAELLVAALNDYDGLKDTIDDAPDSGAPVES